MADHVVLFTIGGLLPAGLAMDQLGQRTKLPRVTLLVLLGIVVGSSGLDILPAATPAVKTPAATCFQTPSYH